MEARSQPFLPLFLQKTFGPFSRRAPPFPISNFQFPISNFQFPISNSQFPISNFQFPSTWGGVLFFAFSARNKCSKGDGTSSFLPLSLFLEKRVHGRHPTKKVGLEGSVWEKVVSRQVKLMRVSVAVRVHFRMRTYRAYLKNPKKYTDERIEALNTFQTQFGSSKDVFRSGFELFRDQRARCAVSGIGMERNPSLDAIDPRKGHVKVILRWICRIWNTVNRDKDKKHEDPHDHMLDSRNAKSLILGRRCQEILVHSVPRSLDTDDRELVALGAVHVVFERFWE